MLDSYRFGFNGKENIDEVYGKGNLPDLGDRMEDVRLGRLNWNTDRKQAEYPWQSPYAYYGNSPIWQIDYNGEGGTKDNPKDPTHQKGITTGKTAKRVFNRSGGLDKYNETMKKIKLEKVDIEPQKYASTSSGSLSSDSPGDEAEKYNTYSNSDVSYYKIANENEFSEKDIVNYLLGSFIYGTGKENIYFDENSKFSKSFSTSFSFNGGAMEEYYSTNIKNLQQGKSLQDLDKVYFKYGASEQASDFVSNYFSFLSASNLVGSYSVTTKTTDKNVEFYIYNVTSISSGSFGKHFGEKIVPTSAVRFKDKKTPYGNTSQVFKVVVPLYRILTDGLGQ